ncbi:MAG: hypothetical protein ACQERI_05455 [Candidatus Krumholzibacteriota bacterium]
MSGSSVLFAVSGSGNSVVQPAGVTGTDGLATGTLASTVAELKTVRATIDGSYMADSLQIEFNPGNLDRFVITSDGYAVAGVGENITFETLDSEGNRITDYNGIVSIYTNTVETIDRIEWGIGTGTGTIISENGDTLQYQFADTDNGQVTFVFRDTKAELINIIAESGSVIDSSGDITVDHAGQDRVLVYSGNNQRAVVDKPVPEPLVVRVEDEYSNPVDNSQVTFSVINGGGIIDTDTIAAGIQDGAFTGSEGLAECQSWILGTTSGYNSDLVRAEIGSGTINSVQFVATSDHDKADSITLTPASGEVTVGSSTILTAELRDRFANLVTGQEAWVYIKDQQDGFLSEDAGNSNPTTGHGPGTRSGTTDSTGTITVIYNAPPSAGLVDIMDAYHSLVPAESVTDVQFTTVASGATRLAVEQISPEPVQAGETFSFVVKAEDSNGNIDPDNNSHIVLTPETGGGIVFSLTDFGTEITEADLSGGEITIYARGEKEGNWNIHVDASAPVLTAVDFPAEIIPNSTIAYYTITAPSDVVAGKNFGVEVRAKDSFANFIKDASRYIRLRAVSDADTSAASRSVLSVTEGNIVDGVFSTSAVSYDLAERIRIEVTDTISSIVKCSETLNIDHAPAFSIIELGGDSTMVTAGDSVLLRAAVEDRYGNRVDAEIVSFAVLEGGGGVESAQRLTGSDGTASVGYGTGTSAGTNRVRAAILDGSPEGLETVMYEIETVSGNDIDYVELEYTGSTYQAGEAIPCSISAYDQNGNLVASDSTTGLIPVSERAGMYFSPDTVTLAGGLASFTAFDPIAGQNRISIESLSGEVLYPFNDYITIIPASAYQITEVSGDTTGVISGDAVELKARVMDRYGNTIEDEVVRFSITSNLGGSPSLIDDTGDPLDGLVLSDAGGAARCSLVTDTNTGLNLVEASILDGDPPDRETVEFSVQSSAGNISRYEISVGQLIQEAGVSFDAEIVGIDLNGNIAFSDDTTRVVPGSSGSAVFSSDTLTLTGGAATVTVIDSIAERIALSAETAGGGALSYSDTLTIVPGDPAGSIDMFSVVPDTITANGISRSAITTEPVRDSFGNVVQEGSQITVTPSAGTISSDDFNNLLPGVQRVTGGSGRVSVFVTSGDIPSDVLVDFQSVEGSALGQAQLVFAPPPDCRYAGFIEPQFIVPGVDAQFRCRVENLSTTGIYINSSSSISLSDGTHTYTAQLGVPVFLSGLSADTLTFEQATVPAEFYAGTYSPEVYITGTDIYSSGYSAEFNAGNNSVAVSNIKITDVTPEKAVVSRGDTTGISVTVKNGGGTAVVMEDIQLQFSNGDYGDVGGWAPALNDTLLPGLIRTYTRNVRVLPFSPIGPDTVDAIAQASIPGGIDVFDYSADENKGVLLIQSGARLSYMPGTLDPEVVSTGQEHSFSFSVENLGEATLSIKGSQTYIEFADMTETFTAFSASDVAVAGLEITEMRFSSEQIPASMTTGIYPLTLHVNGSENGAPFDTSFVIADSVNVVAPASLQYLAGTLDPVSVSKGSSVSFSAVIFNSGGAEIDVDEDSTAIAFDDGVESFTASLQKQPAVVLSPGNNTVYFESEEIPEAMNTGDYEPVIVVRGNENGIPFAGTVITGDTISVQNPSQIAINRTDLPARITQDQAQWWEALVELENNGEASVRLDSIRCRLFSGGNEVTDEYIINQIDFDPGVDILNGGQVDSFRVRLEDNGLNNMTPGMIVMDSYIWGTDLNSNNQLVATTESGGKGGFLVETPAVPVVRGIYTSVDKATAMQERDWTVDVIFENEGESDLEFSFDPLQSYLVFSTSDDFALNYPSSFVSGSTVLPGGGVDTMRVEVDITGSVSGNCTVNIEATATEINSSRIISPITAGPSEEAEVSIQSPAQLTVTGVTALQDPVTIGQPNQWSIDLDVANTGGSDIELDTSNYDSTFVDIPQGSGFVFDFPGELESGGRLLAPSESGTLRFNVTSTGTVAPGRQVLTAAAAGTEINSGATVYYEYGESVSTDSLTFQLPPAPSYASGSLLPSSVSKGTDIQISLQLSGGGPEYSTLDLERSSTYAYFADAQGDTFKAVLSPLSGTVLEGGSVLTLNFESSRVDTSIEDGLYEVNLHLQGYENGNYYQADISTAPDVINVEKAPRLSIISMLNPSSVTASLQPSWDVRMVLHNTGEASVDLDLSESGSYLTFNIPPSGDITGEYDLVQPERLERSGTSILAGNQVDTLIFTVQTTGSTTGTAIINGHVTASDVNSGIVLTDDTFSGGGSYISVQQPGELEITETLLSQSSVTSGQTSPWQVEIELVNTGGAAVSLVPDSTYIYSDYTLDVPAPPVEFKEGGTTLSAGESGHLVFEVTPTPEASPGVNLSIYARAGVIEDNRAYFLYYDSGEQQSGFSSILLQSAPDLRTAALQNRAERNPFVNYGQRFPLAVSVENRGEAAASGLEISLSGDGASLIENPVHTIEEIAGMQAVYDTFFVQASSVSGIENFAASIGSALDTNSGESRVVRYSEALDSTAAADIQAPGLLEVDRLASSQSYVNAGQTVNWYLKAVVANRGEAPVTLLEPAADDVTFNIDMTELGDYLVVPPDMFMSGAPDLTLAGGEADSLEFVISTTGIDTGTVDINVSVDWVDNNMPDSTLASSEGNSSILVREPSGLRIISVTSSAPNSSSIPNTSFVNTGQEFEISVELENTGGDALDSIDVALATDGSSVITMVDSSRYLADGSRGSFVYSVKAPGQQGVEVLTASIARAVSVNTGEEVEPVQAVESSENLYIQLPADLVCATSIIMPQGAVDDTVSAGQVFTLEASVFNDGQAQVDDSGELRIMLPQEFSLTDSQQQPAIRSFAAGEKIQWSIRCPVSVSDFRSDTISVEIYTLPLDFNTAQPAFSSVDADSILVTTESPASITGCGLSITSPDGAVDGVLSTGQNFTVTASVEPSDNSYSCWAQLSLPAGYSSSNELYREIGSGDGTARTVDWNLTAPVNPDNTPVTIELATGGVDENSGFTFTGCSAAEAVETEQAAILNLAASITGPDQALEGILSLGLPFTVGARVTNKGSAGIDTSGARLEIETPAGYTVTGQSSKPFYPGEPVSWNLMAPSEVTNPGNIYVRFSEPYAADINSNSEAEADTAEVSIPVRTEAGKIRMSNLSSDSIPPRVVPQGARDVQMLKVGFLNESVYTVGLDSIYFSISGKNGNILDDPSRAADSISLVTSSRIFSAAVGNINPVPVAVDHAFTIDSLSADTVMVSMDVAENGMTGQIILEIAGNSDVVFSIGQGAVPVGISWIEGGDIAGHFRNSPFNVMSGEFKEYAHNYPNPFMAGTENTRITYLLEEPSAVSINIYDYTGIPVWSRQIEASGSSGGGPAWYEVEWDGRNENGYLVRNGVYICKIVAGGRTAVFKIAVTK